MPIYSDVITRLDERAARAVADDIDRHFSEAGRTASTALQREISTGFTGLRGLVNEFGSGLRSGMDSQLRGLGGSFDAVSSKVSGIGVAGLAAVGGVAAIGTAAAVAGKQLYDLGAQWDAIADGITVRTGKVGDELKALTDVVGDVGSSTAASLGSIGDIVGQISQSMPDLAQNNNAVRQMASNLAYLDANGQAVNIRELGKAFSAFNVNAADQVETLDALNNVSQATGIPINQLIQTVKDGAPQFKQFGLSIGESTGLIATFEDAGLDSGRAVTGLQIALKNLGGDARGAGPALADAVTQIKAFHDANQEGAAQQLAKDTFGAKTFAPFLDAIESGRLGVEGLNKALDQTGITVEDMQKQTDDGAQGWQKLKNAASEFLKPVGDFLFSNVNQPLLLMQENLKNAADGLKDLAAVQITPDSALGKMLLPGGGLPGMAGVPAPNGAGSALGQPTLKPYSWGTDPISPPAAAKGATGLPGAPGVPYDTTLPPGFAGLPQTAELYSAESSFLDARHGAAEKRARLNQLEHDNNATADDITNARNDVIAAERNQNEAELRLYDTQNKQLKKQVTELGDIGVQIDQDFGISKGLPGIAENLTKFIANLATAPLLGPLAAISQAQGGIDKTGSGLVGMLASQGAFGPQYTPAGMAAAEAAAGGGGGGASAVLGPGGVSMMPTGAGGGARVPYGLPAGSNSGGYGGGGTQFPDWVNQLGAAFGIKPSTYPGHQESNRSEAGFAPNPNDENRGIDWSGPVENMQKFADYLKTIPQDLEQVIWQNPNTGQRIGVAGGQDVSQSGYYAGDYGGHQNHVHTRQSESIPLPGGGGGGGGGAPGGLNWDALAAKESSGNWSINSGNGYFGGLQFDQSTWEQYGGTGNPAMASKEQQIAVAQRAYDARGGGSSLWPQNFGQLQIPSMASGGGIPIIAHPGEHMLNAKDVSAMGGQGAVYDFRNALHMDTGGAMPGPSPFLDQYKQSITSSQAPPPAAATHDTPGPAPGGMPGMDSAPHAGSGAPPGPSPIGGAEKPTPSGASEGSGGLLNAAASAAGGLFPGAGAVAQIASQEINRAIKFGSQALGIGVGGFLDTFLPTGGSDLANNNWITRVAGSFAGVQPQIPNTAGKSASVDAMAQRPTPSTMALPPPISSGQGSGAAPGPSGPQITNNITLNNNGAANDPNTNAMGDLLNRQYQGVQR